MTADELKKKFINFFEKRDHQLIPSASLIPENDPTTLFISAGMHPLVPYLLGEVHPQGKNLCSIQRCLRTDDIDSVGDGFHHTFFEMLGNWSLGEYWKKKAIEYSWEFLTKILNFNPQSISVSCFAGDRDAPRDEESALIWQKVGIPKERIFYLPKKDNWWGPVGQTGPCGPDSEMFIDTGKPKCSSKCDVSCQCGKYIEVWNDVFMQYNKTTEGKYEPLKQKNVDTGMGVERVVAITSRFSEDDYRTELFWPIIQEIEKISGKSYEDITNQKPMRIVADHLKAAVFLAYDGVKPGNKQRGYVMRRLIRRAVIKILQLEVIPQKIASSICQTIVDIYRDEYFNRSNFKITDVGIPLRTEIDAFLGTINRGTKLLQSGKTIDGKMAFDLYQTYGFPFEITLELLEEWKIPVKRENLEKEFIDEMKRHREQSRTASVGMFKGGLADHSEIATKYHTATHLLHAALREILGKEVHQAGSNITAERLRFDFTYSQKPTDEQIKKAREIVNQKIKEDLPVTMEVMSLSEAQKLGAMAFFEQKYSKQVKVYSIGPSTGSGFPFSREICAGPHVTNTGEIGEIEIFKEESSGTGKRRIYARMK